MKIDEIEEIVEKVVWPRPSTSIVPLYPGRTPSYYQPLDSEVCKDCKLKPYNRDFLDANGRCAGCQWRAKNDELHKAFNFDETEKCIKCAKDFYSLAEDKICLVCKDIERKIREGQEQIQQRNPGKFYCRGCATVTATMIGKLCYKCNPLPTVSIYHTLPSGKVEVTSRPAGEVRVVDSRLGAAEEC